MFSTPELLSFVLGGGTLFNIQDSSTAPRVGGREGMAVLIKIRSNFLSVLLLS